MECPGECGLPGTGRRHAASGEYDCAAGSRLKVPGHEVRRQFTRCAALGRMVKAADVSRVVLFPCSEAGENITGHAIEASAGFGLWPG